MKKFTIASLLMIISLNANAGFLFGYMLGNMANNSRNNEQTKEIVIDSTKNDVLICEYRINSEKCVDFTKTCINDKCFVSPAQYAGSHKYTKFHKRQLENNGRNWYLIMDVWR